MGKKIEIYNPCSGEKMEFDIGNQSGSSGIEKRAKEKSKREFDTSQLNLEAIFMNARKQYTKYFGKPDPAEDYSGSLIPKRKRVFRKEATYISR